LLGAIPLATFLTACGGGGGGKGGTPAATGLSSGTFDKNIELDGAASNNVGIFGTAAFRHYQWLVRSQDLNASGAITGISFRRNADIASAVSCPNVTIKIGNSTTAALTSNMASGGNVENGVGSLTTALNDATVNIAAGAAASYFRINFTTPVYVNNQENVVVDVTRTAACTPGAATIRTHSAAVTFDSQALTGDSGVPDTATFVGTDLADMTVHFTGGDNSLVYTDSPNVNNYPFNNNTYRKIQLLYPASDVNGSGRITGIGLQLGNTTGATHTVTVRLGHTNLTNLTTTSWDSNFTGSTSTVATNASLTIPVGKTGYVWLPISGSFDYNGTDNLLVELDVPTGTLGPQLVVHNTGGDVRRVWGQTGNSVPAGSNGTTYDAKFRFHGSTMDVIGPNDTFTQVFGNGSSGRQFMVRAAELGTAGSITKLACRINSNSVAASYTAYNVVLAHTNQAALANVDADNVIGGTTVFSGTLNIPAGLKAGDWVEIPFSNTFGYNGTSNLVVQVSQTSGTATQSCKVSGPDANEFPDMWKQTGGSGALDYRGTFRFWLNK